MTWERGHRETAWLRAWVLVAAAFASATAFAQAPSPTGLRVGAGVLHAFLEGDGRYDSLVGYFQKSGLGEPLPTGDIIVHVRPGLKYELSSPSTVVNFNGSVEYLYYTGFQGAPTSQLSRFQAAVAADSAFNKDGAVEFQLSDALNRSDRTQNPAVAVGVLSLYNSVRAAAPIHPGGRALEITPSVAWGIELFSPLSGGSITGCPPNDIKCDPTKVQQMNYSNVSLGLNSRWKFLPKTALMVDVGSDFRTYWDTTAPNKAASLLRVQAGLAGLISTHFNVTLLAGYAHDFAGTNLNNVIGEVDVGYSPTEMIRASLGYLRTVQPVPSLANYIDDRIALKGSAGLWAGRLTFSANAAIDFLNYYYATTARSDWIVSFGAGAVLVVTSWSDVGLSYGGSVRHSSDTALASNNTARHEVTLRLGVRY